MPVRIPRVVALTAFLLAVATPRAADPATLSIAADTAGDSTRVVFTLSRPMACEVRPSGRTVEITCADPVSVLPASRDLDDALLAGWEASGDRRVVLRAGPGYERFESFELKNPSRIVVDLVGSRPSRDSRPRPEAEAHVSSKPVVVLDPGHGGVETGATGPTGLLEKDVALDIARRVERLLERQGMTVVLTRDDDRVLPLDDRTAIANHNKAELFVSIHLNASRRPSATGAETWFLSPEATDDEARTVAALENKAYAPAGDGSAEVLPEADRGLELILWDLAQNRYLERSGHLAEQVQRELNALTGVKDRGVRQAPFRVLMGATMPAILVEAGFLSNPEEESKLKDDAYKERVADAIARAIAGFRGAP